MRALVIGGMQSMGRRIVELLLERGHDVAVLRRRSTHDLGPEVRNLQADRGHLASVAQRLRRENVEAVFDLAYDWENGTPASHVEAAARGCGDRLQRDVFMSGILRIFLRLGLFAARLVHEVDEGVRPLIADRVGLPLLGDEELDVVFPPQRVARGEAKEPTAVTTGTVVAHDDATWRQMTWVGDDRTASDARPGPPR
jgi:NAD(P)-dependent dehydrogenase (short-subunit alcohol dehydrogenase family)